MVGQMLDDTLAPNRIVRALSMAGCTGITTLPSGRILATYCNRMIRVSLDGEVTDHRKRLLFRATSALDIWNKFVYDTSHMDQYEQAQ